MTGFMVYQSAVPWNGNTLTAGFDWKKYGGDAVDASADYPAYWITEYAPYAHMQQLFGKKLIASAGLRAEHHSLFGWEMLPKAGLVFHPTPMNSIRVSAAKGFRSPSIRELYFWMPANAELTPDRVWNYELGVSQEFGTLMKLELTLFQSEGSNLIQFSGPPPRWVNSGDYTHKGVEFQGDLAAGSSLTFSGSFTFMDLGDEVYNIPKQKISLQASWQWRRVRFSGNMLSVHDWKSASFPGPGPAAMLHDMKDYTVFNMSALVNLVRGLSFRLNVLNLTDTDYQALYGYPMPGRTWMGNFAYAF